MRLPEKLRASVNAVANLRAWLHATSLSRDRICFCA